MTPMPTILYRRISLAILAVGMLLLPLRLFAAPIVSEPITESIPAFHTLAFEDDHGGFYLLWTHALAESSLALAMRHIDAQGHVLWSEAESSVTIHLDGAEDWTAFADGRGGLTAAWRQGGLLYAWHRDADGAASWPVNQPVSASTAPFQNLTGVADPAGGAYLLWSEAVYGKRFVLEAQHLDGSGRPLWKGNDQRVSLRPSDQRQPSIVFDAKAGAIIAWNDKRENASQLEMQRLDYQADRLWGLQGTLVTAPAGREAPILVPLSGSRSAVAWTGTQSASNRIFVQTVDSTGTLSWGPDGIALSQGQGDQWNPVLAGAPDGSLWAAWEDYRDQTHWNIFLTRLSTHGQSIWPERELALDPVSADQGHVALVDDGQHGLFAAWLDNRAGRAGLYLQHVDGNGQKKSAGSEILASHLKSPVPPQLVAIAPGKVAVVWADQPKKHKWTLTWMIVAP